MQDFMFSHIQCSLLSCFFCRWWAGSLNTTHHRQRLFRYPLNLAFQIPSSYWSVICKRTMRKIMKVAYSFRTGMSNSNPEGLGS
uniref:Secreted protein n=1 Tax=Pyxicephalus adspersus TaxID=30357 RepID=A0AAV2ZRL4_PYXAD|nr:TPA: hypothetical protein GDO54_005421 [Pyxicephalus adspersus]